MEDDFYTYLAANTSIAAVVDRIYVEVAPQRVENPYVVFTVDGGDVEYNFDGYPSMESDEYTVDCFADTYTEAKTIANTVRNELKNFQNSNMGDAFVYTVQAYKITFLHDEDLDIYRASFSVVNSYKGT